MNKNVAFASMSNQDLLQEGFRALNSGQIAAATECCREVLKRRPDLIAGHFLVGLVALEAGDRKTAFSAFRSVTKLQPKHAAAWAHLARLFMTEGQVNRADIALAEAVQYVGDEAIVEDLLGVVYSLMGEYGLAGERFTRAIDLQPDHPPYMLNHANNLVYHGRTDDAQQVFRRIVSIQPHSPQAHWALAGASRARDRGHIDEMQKLLAGGHVHPRAQAFYHYAIGKEFEDLQKWEAAFDAFSAGAAARRKTVEFDEAAEIEMFRFLEERVTPDAVAQASAARAGRGPEPTNVPIFILGQPRTGTTLIERIVASHSQVHSAGELQQFALAIRRLSRHRDPRRFSPALFEAALALEPAAVGALYLETTRRMQGGKGFFTDKLPQNYLMIPFILAALPDARIVHLTRDPIDASFASFKQLFADAYLHSYDQREMARHHARYCRLMQTWRERFPGRFLDISYEDTVHDLEANARRLIEFLRLPWDDACLEFHRQKTAVSTASAVQVRQPVHTRSVGRWRKYAHRLQPLIETLAAEGITARS